MTSLPVLNHVCQTTLFKYNHTKFGPNRTKIERFRVNQKMSLSLSKFSTLTSNLPDEAVLPEVLACFMLLWRHFRFYFHPTHLLYNVPIALSWHLKMDQNDSNSLYHFRFYDVISGCWYHICLGNFIKYHHSQFCGNPTQNVSFTVKTNFLSKFVIIWHHVWLI